MTTLISRPRELAMAWLDAWFPRLSVGLRAMKGWFVSGESELRLLPMLAEPAEVAFDVGGNTGLYTFWLRRHFRSVLVFEPNPDLHELLRRSFGGDVRVEPYALGEQRATATLFIPSRSDGAGLHALATLEPETTSHYGKGLRAPVEVRRLDDYAEHPVGFVKIDVEGHELAVLHGGTRLIRQQRPTVLVEAEERHRKGAVHAVTEFLTQEGYQGFFLVGRWLWPISSFDLALHQGSGSRPYVRNFLFIGRTRVLNRLRSRIIEKVVQT